VKLDGDLVWRNASDLAFARTSWSRLPATRSSRPCAGRLRDYRDYGRLFELEDTSVMTQPEADRSPGARRVSESHQRCLAETHDGASSRRRSERHAVRALRLATLPGERGPIGKCRQAPRTAQ
jgi:hypothetical protein